jgi:hypothetical protein
MKAAVSPNGTAVVTFPSEKKGEIIFTEDEVQRYGRVCIEKHIEYLDRFYKKHVNDAHALIINAIVGKWGWDKEMIRGAVPTVEETARMLDRKRAYEKQALEDRKTPEYHEAVQKFFNLFKTTEKQV